MWSSQWFHCSFASDPPSIFAWSRDKPLMKGGTELDGDGFKVFQNGTLQIKNVTWERRGNYFCNVMNSEGSETRLVELTVKGIKFMEPPFHVYTNYYFCYEVFKTITKIGIIFIQYILVLV